MMLSPTALAVDSRDLAAHAADSEFSLESLYEQDWTRVVAAVSAENNTLWLDSACFTHVCPLDAFAQFSN